MNDTRKQTKNFVKTVRMGAAKTYHGWYSIFCQIEYRDGRLSITGVEGPLQTGHCLGSCGQINMSLNVDDIAPAKGWSKDKIQQFLNYWEKYHFNDMQAGSPRQTEYLKSIKEHWDGEQNYRDGRLSITGYNRALNRLKEAGLQPDTEFLYTLPGKEDEGPQPYSYGTAWLSVQVPSKVLDFMRALPDTDKEPAWV